jgi:signal transduction histidine kinase
MLRGVGHIVTDGTSGQSLALRYSLAVALVGIAVVLTLLFWNAGLSRNPFAFFFAAVMLSAWLGGLGPGLATTVLAVLAIEYFFLFSFHHLFLSWGDLIHVAVFAGVAVLISSLTARNRQALETAEAASHAKDQFLAVLSHELRTPLTPALAIAEALEHDQALPDRFRSDLQIIRRNMELEARLIDDLLDLTRIARGKLQLYPGTVDLHALVHHVLDICRPDADSRGVELDSDLRAESAWVMGDSGRLHQVVWNLVKNAVKFTPAGGSVTVASQSYGDRLVVQVTDTGLGIDSEVLPTIFDAFEQGKSNAGRGAGGLGLGLTITRALVEAHGGTLNAHSEGHGTGSCFTIDLPALPPEQIPAETATMPMRSVAARHLRLLLVEDHEDTARVMSRLLRECNYDVQTASSVKSALERAEREPYDLVISDLGLPDGSGLDLMQELRNRYDLKGIALSGYGMEDDIRRSREAGFVAHLTKPVNFQSLQAAIQQIAA